MTELSARMERITEAVKNLRGFFGNPIPCVADIGCDHAWVSIGLVEDAIAARVIASDLRPGPLVIAAQNIGKYGFEDNVELRLSDGFEHYVPGEIQTAVISGMGGRLICEILERGERFLDQGIGLCLSPHQDTELVRRYVLEHGYVIWQEDMVIDAGKYYNILTAVPADRLEKPVGLGFYSPVELAYGKQMLDAKSEVLRFYLNKELRNTGELLSRLAENDTEHSRMRTEELKRKEALIKEALSFYASN